MNSLFQKPFIAPLANQLRPQTWQELEGQPAAKQFLQNLLSAQSLILYGPAGSGKTTIAHILCRQWQLPFRQLNAVDSGVKDIKKIISEAEQLGSILLFLDEIHRFNTAQQDSLLAAVESGCLILVGATSENPAFRIVRPLLSRLQLIRLEGLDVQALRSVLQRAQEASAAVAPVLTEAAINRLINLAHGDARLLLTSFETLCKLRANKSVDLAELDQIFSAQVLNYDQHKDQHYDFISAFIKSIRGSDPDAAVLYLAYMLEGGEDPVFIARRLLILASEDVGNAAPQALPIALAALTATEKLGMPEARIVLSQAVTFLASCPKSNAAYTAIDEAIKWVKNNRDIKVPLHLRNAPTQIHKSAGHGQNYRYPHDDEGGFVLENYFPEGYATKPPQFYFPKMQGQEKAFRERLQFLWSKSTCKKY